MEAMGLALLSLDTPLPAAGPAQAGQIRPDEVCFCQDADHGLGILLRPIGGVFRRHWFRGFRAHAAHLTRVPPVRNYFVLRFIYSMDLAVGRNFRLDG